MVTVCIYVSSCFVSHLIFLINFHAKVCKFLVSVRIPIVWFGIKVLISSMSRYTKRSELASRLKLCKHFLLKVPSERS